MSIFDPARRILSPEIFGPDAIMLPDVQKHLIAEMASVIPEEKVYKLALVGSLVTYQYTETSDIDIQVMAVKGEAYDAWHEVFKQYNAKYQPLPGTKHPITFFFVEYIAPEREGDWKNSQGAYDIYANKWLKLPTPPELIKDPAEKYARELHYISMILKMVDSEVNAIRLAIESGDKERALISVKTLQKYFQQVERDRKDAYQWGGGPPSSSEDNVIYKLLEHGPYGQLFKDLLG